jgi:iron(III) transport system ATP-binding protein
MTLRTVLRVDALEKAFGTTRAVAGVTLEVHAGEVVALLGPSGCGKTTLLRLIAGLERPDAGTIVLGDRTVSGGGTWVPPERRRVGLVFQEWALFPHLDVLGNIAFGLSKDDQARARELLALVHLDGLGDRLPHELSGGQQQRVALARALAPRPDLLLLDEPFSNLDAQLRAAVRADVREVLRVTGTTAVLVTHDQEEALSVADRVAVMIEGTICQTGSPFEIYAHPSHPTVARLVGEANLVPALVASGIGTCALGSFPAPGIPDGRIDALIRPEALRPIPDPSGPATIVDIEFYGHDQLVRCDADGLRVDVRLTGPHPEFTRGSRVRLDIEGPVIAIPGPSGHGVPTGLAPTTQTLA